MTVYFFEQFPYLNILIYIGIVIAVAISMLIANYLLGPKRKKSKEKNEPYECGVDPAVNTNKKFNIKFYIIAALFLLFDIEIIFIIPWAIIYKDMISIGLGMFLLIDMIIFIFILVIGLFYILKKGALKWD